MSLKACEQCGKEFTVNVHNQRFCSHNCEAKAWAVLHREKMRESCRRWAASHREERRAYKQHYEQEHRTERLKHKRMYYREHCVKALEYAANYRRIHHEDPERLERCRVAAREYYKRHLSEYNAYSTVRRALKLAVTVGNLTEIREIYHKAKEDPKVRCYLCGRLIPKGHRHVDHIVPLTKGGSHRPSNLAVACDKCNREKYNKMPKEVGILL